MSGLVQGAARSAARGVGKGVAREVRFAVRTVVVCLALIGVVELWLFPKYEAWQERREAAARATVAQVADLAPGLQDLQTVCSGTVRPELEEFRRPACDALDAAKAKIKGGTP